MFALASACDVQGVAEVPNCLEISPNKSPENICCWFLFFFLFLFLSALQNESFQRTIRDSTQPNQESIITTKGFLSLEISIHSPFSLNFTTGLTLHTETNDNHCKLKERKHPRYVLWASWFFFLRSRCVLERKIHVEQILLGKKIRQEQL